jgi:3'(2'), 5'-bisphosphate nucleotidase
MTDHNTSSQSTPSSDAADLDLSAELAFTCRLAREAGTIVNTFYVGTSEVKYKHGNEPVTEADRAANEHIVERITAAYPDDGILSEEAKDNLARLEKQRVWIVDPMDGTKEFIARNGEFSIMIGLAIDGVATLGVIYQPATDLLYGGIVGQGAFLEESGERIPLHVSDKADPRQMITVSSRSHRQQIVDRMRQVLRITSERVSGSVGLKVGLVSRQLADLYIHPSPGCKEWDLCAPEAVLRAAGGIMTDCWGNPLRYNQRDIRAHNGLIATNGPIHQQIVNVVSGICEAAGFTEEDGFW